MQLCYERRGVGPPLVLPHGIGHRWQAWLPVLDLLAESRDVIAIDLPGFGGTPLLPGRPFGLESLEETFADICAVLDVERPHVAGNSLGGLVWPTAVGCRYRYAGRPRVPVPIAWGAKDRILPVWRARRARRLLPDARHVVLPGCGHVPMSDSPELVARVLLEGSGEPS